MPNRCFAGLVFVIIAAKMEYAKSVSLSFFFVMKKIFCVGLEDDVSPTAHLADDACRID